MLASFLLSFLCWFLLTRSIHALSFSPCVATFFQQERLGFQENLFPKRNTKWCRNMFVHLVTLHLAKEEGKKLNRLMDWDGTWPEVGHECELHKNGIWALALNLFSWFGMIEHLMAVSLLFKSINIAKYAYCIQFYPLVWIFIAEIHPSQQWLMTLGSWLVPYAVAFKQWRLFSWGIVPVWVFKTCTSKKL